MVLASLKPRDHETYCPCATHVEPLLVTITMASTLQMHLNNNLCMPRLVLSCSADARYLAPTPMCLGKTPEKLI